MSNSVFRWGLWPAVALELGGFAFERFETLLGQRFQGPFDDQIDECLGRVEAAAVLAGIGVGSDDDLAVVADRLLLKQPLVDRAELLHGHVTVVDEVAIFLRVPGVAQVVDDGRDCFVGQADSFQQRRGVGREQAAVVWRKADGWVASVDEREERHQVVVVAGGHGREGVSVFHPACDIVPYFVFASRSRRNVHR